MTISGYRVKLINKDGDNNGEEQDTHGTVGWLHVDYAMVSYFMFFQFFCNTFVVKAYPLIFVFKSKKF